MIKKYLEQVKTRAPHERRVVAMQISGVITALLLVVWVSSLGVRLAHNSDTIAKSANQASNVAATLISVPFATSTQSY